MLEIAGGILLAIVILAALPYLLVGAYWALAIGICLAIAVGIWFALAAVVGPGWAWAISIAAVVIWLAWYEKQEADFEKAKAEKDALSAKVQEAERLAETERLEREQQARIEAWNAEEEIRKEREKCGRESRQAAWAAKEKADREMCINALREGRDVIGIDGRKKTLRDFGVYD